MGCKFCSDQVTLASMFAGSNPDDDSIFNILMHLSMAIVIK